VVPSVHRYVEQVHKTQARLYELEHVISESKNPALRNTLLQRLLAHPAIAPLPNIQLDSHPPIQNPHRVRVADRLLTAYHKALADEARSPLKREGEDLWTGVIRNDFPELLSIIEQRDPNELAEFLMNFGKSFVWFGGVTTGMDSYTRNLDQHQLALTYLDKLA